jgi:hypothetical protein
MLGPGPLGWSETVITLMGRCRWPVQPPGCPLEAGFLSRRPVKVEGDQQQQLGGILRYDEGSERSGNGPSLARESEQAGVRCAMAKTTVVRTTDGRKSTILGSCSGPQRRQGRRPGRPERRRINPV